MRRSSAQSESRYGGKESKMSFLKLHGLSGLLNWRLGGESGKLLVAVVLICMVGRMEFVSLCLLYVFLLLGGSSW